MFKKVLMASLLVGAVALVSTASPAQAKDPNGYAANQMAMQMWMSQQANQQQNAVYAQQKANDDYYAAQNAWATRTVPQNNYNGYYNNGYNNNGYYTNGQHRHHYNGNYDNGNYNQYNRNAYGGRRWGHYYNDHD